MFQLFLYEDPAEPAARARLLDQSVSLYAQKQMPEVAAAGGTAYTVCRTEKGKPYPVNPETGEPVRNLHLSISHSGGLWAVLIGQGNCGLDIQQMRPADWRRLSARFFPEADLSAIQSEDEGLKEFYRLWCRREALAKYTGAGFFGAPETPQNIFYREISLAEGMTAVWCSGEEDDEVHIFSR